MWGVMLTLVDSLTPFLTLQLKLRVDLWLNVDVFVSSGRQLLFGIVLSYLDRAVVTFRIARVPSPRGRLVQLSSLFLDVPASPFGRFPDHVPFLRQVTLAWGVVFDRSSLRGELVLV